MASMGGNSIWFVPRGHKINKILLGGRPSLVKKELVKLRWLQNQLSYYSSLTVGHFRFVLICAYL